MVGQMHGDPVEPVRDRRARRAPCGVIGPEHEVIDEKLRASPEEIGERGFALVGLESILLNNAHPRQFLPPPCDLVAAPCQLFLGLEQIETGGKPFFTCSSLVIGHCFSLVCSCSSGL